MSPHFPLISLYLPYISPISPRCDHAPFRSWPGAAVAASVVAMLLLKLVALGVVSHGCSALKAVALYQVPTLLPLLLCGVIADAAALATLGPNSDGRCP